MSEETQETPSEGKSKKPKDLSSFLSPEEKKKSQSKTVFIGARLDKTIVQQLSERAEIEYSTNGADVFRALLGKVDLLKLLPEKEQEESKSDSIYVGLSMDRETAAKIKESLGVEEGDTGTNVVRALLKKVLGVS